MKFIKLIFFILLFFQSVYGQQPSYYKLGEKQFEGVQIYDIIQDKQLNYWFATDQGFYKYDSYDFKKIECDEMKGLSAFGFVINNDGEIFCYNLNHQILKIKNNTCSVFYEFQEKEKSNDVYLAISKDDNLLAITKTALIFNKFGKPINKIIPRLGYCGSPFLKKNKSTICHISEKDSIIIIEKNTLRVVQLLNKGKKINGSLKFFRINEQAYAVSTKDKFIYAFDETKDELTSLSDSPLIETKEVLRFYNENNQLWIAGTVSGVKLLTNLQKKVVSKLMFSQYLISDVFKDNEGNILLSTFNNGVLVIPNLKIPDVLPLPKEQSIVSIHFDNDIGLLMGTLKGELIFFQNGHNQILSNFGSRPLQALYSWKNFPYIIYDDGPIKAIDKKTGRIFTINTFSLKDAVISNEKDIYLALNSGVTKITINSFNSFKTERISALKMRCYSIEIEPNTNNVFIATADGLKILKKDGRVVNTEYNGKQIFANDLFVEKNTLYVATKKDGILTFENSKLQKQIVPKVNNREFEISKLIISNDRIYTNSSLGFFVFDKQGELLIQLNKMHGFSTNRIFDFEIVANQLWITHSKGVQKIDIDQLKTKIEKPIIKIESIEVNDSIIKDINETTVFDSYKRKFRFIISSPTLRNSENITYHYKLIGYDSKWLISAFSDNKIIYNALAPGDYTFLVKAENQDVFSESLAYSFTISTPFYLSWWFIIASVLIFIISVMFLYRRQISVQRKKSEQLSELNASKLKAILSQMNPHFIFNSLNSIQDLILKGDIENSYSYITTFSNMVRRTLNYSEKDFIDIEQELKLLELYLSLEKLRFKKDLDYKIHIENKEDVMIPPLLIQPFIENALVHGLLHKEGKKSLLITLKIEEMLICTIEDNGVGREKSKQIKLRQKVEHESFSGNAIQKRFEILSKVFGGNFGYVFEDLYEGDVSIGTRVTLKIPLKRKF